MIKRIFIYNIGVLILLFIISGVIYLNSLNNGFYFDDFHYIVENKHIRNLSNIPRFFVDIDTLSTIVSGHYRPLVLVSHTINYSIGRLNPAGYHIVNLTFHVGTAFLVFLIVQAMVTPTLSLHRYPIMGGGKKGGGIPSPHFIALAAALIFAVHPFNSEVVNYITARSSVMSGFFYLLAFYFWVKFRSPPPFPPHRMVREGVYLYMASLLAFLFGMLSKELVITLPGTLLLYDFYFIQTGGKTLSERLKERLRMSAYIIPFVLIVAIPYLIIRSYFLGSALPFAPKSGYYLHLITEAKVVARYIYLLFTPFALSIEHAITPAGSIWETGVIGSLFILAIVTTASFILYKRRDIEWRMVSFFIFWFFIALFPFIIVKLNAPLQENRGYISAIGFAVILGVLLDRFARWNNNHHVLKVAALFLILILYSVHTIDRNSVWASGYTLWRDAVDKSPMSWMAHYNLGLVYQDYKLESLAFREYTKAVELKPDSFDPLFILGVIHLKRGELKEAFDMLERALKVKPYSIKARFQMGKVYEKTGDIEKAKREFVIAIRIGEKLGREEKVVVKAREYLRAVRGQK